MNPHSKLTDCLKFIAEHKYFRESINPCKFDALQKCRDTNLTWCNK